MFLTLFKNDLSQPNGRFIVWTSDKSLRRFFWHGFKGVKSPRYYFTLCLFGLVLAGSIRLTTKPLVGLLALLLLSSPAFAQETPHKFLDRSNVALFALHAATTGWDALETHNGVNYRVCTFTYTVGSQVTGCVRYSTTSTEANPLARPFVTNTPGQVLFFGGTVAANIGAAYLLHRSGHHKLERVVSAVNIGFSLKGASSWAFNRRPSPPPAATCLQMGTCQI